MLAGKRTSYLMLFRFILTGRPLRLSNTDQSSWPIGLHCLCPLSWLAIYTTSVSVFAFLYSNSCLDAYLDIFNFLLCLVKMSIEKNWASSKITADPDHHCNSQTFPHGQNQRNGLLRSFTTEPLTNIIYGRYSLLGL